MHLDEHRALKEAIYHRYEEGLKDLPVKMNPYLENTVPNFWLSCLTIDKGAGVTAMELLSKLSEANIEGRPIWKPMHMQPVFKGHDFISAYDKPVNEDIFERGICLPSDIKMTVEEQNFVIEVIKECFR